MKLLHLNCFNKKEKNITKKAKNVQNALSAKSEEKNAKICKYVTSNEKIKKTKLLNNPKYQP